MNSNMPSDDLPNEQATSIDSHNLTDLMLLAQALNEQVAKMRRQMMSRRIKYGKAAKKAQREQQQ